MVRRIIGITGLAGSGKDTIGDIITSNLKNWEKVSFASHLKDVTALLFGMDRKMLAGETPEDRAKREQPDEFWSKKMGKDFTPRYALQFLGTNLLRNQLHQNIWVDCLEKKIMNTDKNIVITDVRFPNEIDMIRSIGGEIWRVERGELPHWFRDVEHINDKDNILEYDIPHFFPILKNIHESEWRWVGYDKPSYIFENNGSIEDLKNKVLNKMNMMNMIDEPYNSNYLLFKYYDDDDDVMTIEEFIENVESGFFTDYDGIGYLGTKDCYCDSNAILPSQLEFCKEQLLNSKFTHVIWFNR